MSRGQGQYLWNGRPSGPHFQKRGPKGVLKLSGNKTAQPPQESLFQGAGKEAPADCQTSASGGTMWILSWPWNSGPALYPCRVVGGAWEFAHPIYICFVDLEKAYDCVPRGILWGVLREYGVLSGCWTPPRLSLVNDFVRDFHGQNIKPQPR